MHDRPQAVLRLEPHQIPALRAAFDKAAQDMSATLAQEPRIPDPWLADQASETVRRVYNAHAVDAPGSAYQHFTAYRDELALTARALAELEDTYRRTEGDNVALCGRVR